MKGASKRNFSPISQSVRELPCESTYGHRLMDSAVVADNFAKTKVFTVASERTPGFELFMRSARLHDVEVNVLGLNQEWKGGTGGGYKVNLLRDALAPYKDESNTVIIFADGYDVIFTSGLYKIVNGFKNKFGGGVLFSAEKYCWPDRSLASNYPEVKPEESRYLNSGLFMGNAPAVYALLKEPIDNKDDDQLYFTKSYLNAEVRRTFHIHLDTKSEIFQNLNGAEEEVSTILDPITSKSILFNKRTQTMPGMLHGNGMSKNAFYKLEYDLTRIPKQPCLDPLDIMIALNESALPVIYLAVIITKPVPFFDMFLARLESLDYPKQNMHLFIFCGHSFHDNITKSFFTRLEKEYAYGKLINSTESFDEVHGRKLALQEAEEKKCDYILFIDGDTHIDDPKLLRILLKMNRSLISPLVPNELELLQCLKANAGSRHLVDVILNNITHLDVIPRSLLKTECNLWETSYVSSIYLIKRAIFQHINYEHPHYRPDYAMCESLQDANIPMFVLKNNILAHTVVTVDFNISRTRPDFYMFFSNGFDWMRKYVHPNYTWALRADTKLLAQPCPDVFWVQIVTDVFCDDLIAIMEDYGNWSKGVYAEGNKSENHGDRVPTVDIHMIQVGLKRLWDYFVQIVVYPLQIKVFYGFDVIPNPRESFVVRYSANGGQTSLRPHFDSAQYSINIALNRVNIDYEGGGTRFLRYNCSVIETRKGWMLMHPSYPTHMHEALTITNGTRYVMVTFIKSYKDDKSM